MYDLLKASDGLIGNGTGNANVNGDVSPTRQEHARAHIWCSSI